MMFFTDTIQIYRGVNAKGRELQSFVRSKYQHCMISSDSAFEYIYDDIHKYMEELDLAYPRTLPFVLYKIDTDEGCMIYASPFSSVDDHIFNMFVSRVDSTLTYPSADGSAQHVFFNSKKE